MADHVDRVRAFLRRRSQMHGIDPDVIYGLDGCEFQLLTSDLDALCRDAERLRELEDL